MMKNYLYSAIFFAFSYAAHLQSVTITASEFNQLYSCANPFRPTETSTIILDEDIVIEDLFGGCEPIVPGPGFNTATDSVIFTATENNAVIIQQAALWIVTINLTFEGNARLLQQTGAILALQQNNPTIRMSGNSIYMPVQS